MIVKAATDPLSINVLHVTATSCSMRVNASINVLTVNTWTILDIVIGAIQAVTIVMVQPLKIAFHVGLDTILPIMFAIEIHVQMPLI